MFQLQGWDNREDTTTGGVINNVRQKISNSVTVGGSGSGNGDNGDNGGSGGGGRIRRPFMLLIP